MPDHTQGSRKPAIACMGLDADTAERIGQAVRTRQSVRQPAQQRKPPRPPIPSRTPTPAQLLGAQGEALAAQHLEQAGLEILARNLSWKGGEIDLVARAGPMLVFVEVRLRTRSSHGGAGASINAAKRRRLIRTAHYFLPLLCRRHFRGRQPPCRFDVVCIEQGQLQWIPDAFTVHDVTAART